MIEDKKVNDILQETINKATDLINNNVTVKDTEKEALFDPLKLYFGEDYIIHNDYGNEIIITQPVIQDFIDYGEKVVYGTVFPFTTNSTSLRAQLWDMGVDWNDVTDYQLFIKLYKLADTEYSHKIFRNLDFSTFEIYSKKTDEKNYVMTLFSEKQNIEIDEKTYTHMATYIRNMFGIHPKVELAKGKSNKIDIINEDKREIAKRKNDNSSILLNMISFALNHPGFKYKKNEMRELGLVEFMDSIQRLQIYESTNSLMKGMYSGFIDTSKIDKNEYNFMRSTNVII